METQSNSKHKHCGNCYHHCVYHYPHKTFCTLRFSKRKSPIVSTLDACENWKQDCDECFCVVDALKKKDNPQ